MVKMIFLWNSKLMPTKNPFFKKYACGIKAKKTSNINDIFYQETKNKRIKFGNIYIYIYLEKVWQ